MNIFQVAGFIGKDAETRFTAEGIKVTNLTLASTVKKKGVGETTWYQAILWGDRFDKLLPYLKKGSAILVIGELKKPIIYTDRTQTQHIKLEINVEMIRFNPWGNTEPVKKQEEPLFEPKDAEMELPF